MMVSAVRLSRQAQAWVGCAATVQANPLFPGDVCAFASSTVVHERGGERENGTETGSRWSVEGGGGGVKGATHPEPVGQGGPVAEDRTRTNGDEGGDCEGRDRSGVGGDVLPVSIIIGG